MPVLRQASRAPNRRLVIVEDEPLFRDVVKQLCEEIAGVQVVAMPPSGEQALEVLARERPDAVILDLGLPGLDGFSLIHDTRKLLPDIKFLVVTANSDDYTLFRLSRAEVSGVVDKRVDDLHALRKAIASFLGGGSFFTGRYLEAARTREQLGDRPGNQLTERERSVLVLIGLGLSNQEIGNRLGISADTAERHRNTLFRKLDVRRTPKLMEIAIKGGFTRIPPGGGGPPAFP